MTTITFLRPRLWQAAGPAALLLLSACAPVSEPVSIHPLEQRLQQVLDGIVADAGAPGGVAAAVLPDGTLVRVASGLASKESGVPMRPDSRLLSGSVGKTFVGALTLNLARRGVLDLDAPISNWLDGEDWFARLPNAESITVRHLVMHRSGLPDHVNLPAFAEAASNGQIDLQRGAKPEELIAFVLDHEPPFAAGDGFAYSDTGYLLLGLVIEAASGETYYGQLRREFLDPLGLTMTSPSDHRRIPGLVAGYLTPGSLGSSDDSASTMIEEGELAYNPNSEWTGGGLATNAGDLARWARALYENDAMPGEYLADLLAGATGDAAPESRTYGMGTGVSKTEFGIVYGHSGWIPGYVSFMGYFPEHGFSVAAQFNTIDGADSDDGPIETAKRVMPQAAIDYLNAEQE